MTKTYEIKASRKAYGEALIELGEKDENIVVLDADLSCSTQTKMFADKFPDRFFNVGVSEQDLIGTSAGLSTCGKTVFASTFAMFASGRCWEQIRNSVAYPKFNVKIVATHGGITVGEDGASHQALEDVSIMRSIPNMQVIVPSCPTEVAEVIKYAAKYNGPMYIRLTRTAIPVLFGKDYKFSLKAQVLQKGCDVTLIANGESMIETINAAEMLQKDGINAEVLNVPVVKPLDCATIIESAKKTNNVITIENHSIIGGLGSAVCEALSESYPTKVTRLGINDEFGQSGEQRELVVHYGLSAEKLYEKIKDILKN